MVFGKFIKGIKESREARLEAERLFKEKCENETAEVVEKIRRDSEHAMGEQQASYNFQTENSHKLQIQNAWDKINEDFSSVCNKIELRFEELEREFTENMSEEKTRPARGNLYEAKIRILSFEKAIFEVSTNSSIAMIKNYGEVPEDFNIYAGNKLEEIEELIKNKQNVLTELVSS